MVYYKFNLDKIDKIFIAVLCIIVTFFCVLNTFCYAAEFEEVETSTVADLQIDPNNNYFTFKNGSSVAYFELESGYIYHITNNAGAQRYFALSNSIPDLNGTYNYLMTLQPGDSYNYLSINDGYMYMDFSYVTNVSITREKVSGFSGAIDDLVNILNPDSFWEVFETAIPYVGVVALSSFGFYLIFHNVKEISKGREKMN